MVIIVTYIIHNLLGKKGFLKSIFRKIRASRKFPENKRYLSNL